MTQDKSREAWAAIERIQNTICPTFRNGRETPEGRISEADLHTICKAIPKPQAAIKTGAKDLEIDHLKHLRIALDHIAHSMDSEEINTALHHLSAIESQQGDAELLKESNEKFASGDWLGAKESEKLIDEIIGALQESRADAAFPMGAITNGRVFIGRLETYGFEQEATTLNMCVDWDELKRCFEYMAEYILRPQHTPAPSEEKWLYVQKQMINDKRFLVLTPTQETNLDAECMGKIKLMPLENTAPAVSADVTDREAVRKIGTTDIETSASQVSASAATPAAAWSLCPECGGQGWIVGWRDNGKGEPMEEQEQCGACNGGGHVPTPPAAGKEG
jgi:hypothetical protein